MIRRSAKLGIGEFGVSGNGTSSIADMATRQIGAAMPDQTSVEMRAQLRKRIKPTPLAIPKIATARQASIIKVATMRTTGTIGGAFGTLDTRKMPSSAKKMPTMVKTLPRMAITPEAV